MVYHLCDAFKFDGYVGRNVEDLEGHVLMHMCAAKFPKKGR